MAELSKRITTKQTLATGLVLVAIVVGGTLYGIDPDLPAAVDAIRTSGAAGMAVFSLVYVVATIAMVPQTILTLVAGFAFGPWRAAALVLPVATLGATLAFLLGRSLLRAWVLDRVAGSRRFRAIDYALGEHGAKLVALLRLSPVVPFNFLNIALGSTKVGALQFASGSLVGMTPNMILYVYLGSMAANVTDLTSGQATGDGGSTIQILRWVGLAATLFAFVLITRAAKRALSSHLT